MFLGHLAVGFGAKRFAPRTSVALLVAACQLPDLIWPLLLLLGIERVRIAPGITAFSPLDFESYPITHSLVTALGWAVVFALIYRALTRYTRGAIWIGVGVFSHWVLDFLTHRPDLQILPWSAARVGLGLWNHPLATVVVEGAMFAIGLWLYLGATRAVGKGGTIGFWSYCALMVALYAGSIAGPPPPSVRALTIVAMATWIFVPWLVWVDRGRPARWAEAAASA